MRAGVSIVDGGQHRFRALAGKPRFDCSRDLSFCGWSLLDREPEQLVVPDLLADPRYPGSWRSWHAAKCGCCAQAAAAL